MKCHSVRCLPAVLYARGKGIPLSRLNGNSPARVRAPQIGKRGVCSLSMLVCSLAMYEVPRVPGRLLGWLGRASVMLYHDSYWTEVEGTGNY